MRGRAVLELRFTETKGRLRCTCDLQAIERETTALTTSHSGFCLCVDSQAEQLIRDIRAKLISGRHVQQREQPCCFAMHHTSCPMCRYRILYKGEQRVSGYHTRFQPGSKGYRHSHQMITYRWQTEQPSRAIAQKDGGSR